MFKPWKNFNYKFEVSDTFSKGSNFIEQKFFIFDRVEINITFKSWKNLKFPENLSNVCLQFLKHKILLD